jgi:hypothetical protein
MNRKATGTKQRARATAGATTTKLDLADHIAAILHDPATPPELHAALADGLCQIGEPDSLLHSAAFIRRQLVVAAADK